MGEVECRLAIADAIYLSSDPIEARAGIGGEGQCVLARRDQALRPTGAKLHEPRAAPPNEPGPFEIGHSESGASWWPRSPLLQEQGDATEQNEPTHQPLECL